MFHYECNGLGDVINNYYTESARFEETNSQSGGDIDTLSPVTLGVGGSDPDGIVTVQPDGVIVINKSGPLIIKQIIQAARDSNPGLTELFFQAQVSSDNGVTWVGIGTTVNRRITNVSTINSFFDILPVFVTAGMRFRNVWCKSSVGGSVTLPTVGLNNGLLIATQPSAALQALGITPIPSAVAIIYKLKGYSYL